MKRWPIYLLILALVPFAPLQRVNVGRMLPVEVVALKRTSAGIQVLTDAEAWGQGMDLAAAVADLKEKTPAVVYLDTAKYLLLEKDLQIPPEQLSQYLKGGVYLCRWDGETDLKAMAKYLEVHGKLPQLRTWKGSTELPYFQGEKNIKKSEKSA